MSRKKFILEHGATCRNWQWSWSFINEDERFVIFGSWDTDEIIFSENWRHNAKGRKTSGFDQSKEHLELVEKQNYRLFTFPMVAGVGDGGIPTIESFTPQLTEKHLLRSGTEWLAIDRVVEDRLAEELPAGMKFPEGAKSTITVNAHERNPNARAACLRHHGYRCAACQFDFEEVYGELGRRFIHVHHVTPLKGIEAEYEVDPIKDLIPVCPNCHAMIHRTDPCQTIEQLRELLQRPSR